MSWWSAKYTNNNGEYEITFASKDYEKAKAVEKVCCAVIDKYVKSPLDVESVVRCRECKNYVIVDEFEGGKRYMCLVNHFSYLDNDGDNQFCSYGERKGADNEP